MKHFDVLKHPRPGTLAELNEVAASAPPPSAPLVRMSEAEFDAWRSAEIAAGWAPAPEPPAVPASVTPWQIRRALNHLGLRATVEAAVAAADQDVRDAWDYALEIRRDNPLLAALASQIGMTSAQLDDLFRLAGSYQ